MDFQVEFLYSKFLQSNGVSTDTRTIEEENMFFALSGPNFNGNLFAERALELGASFAVVDDPSVVKNSRYLLVDNTLEALQSLAKFHRSRFKRKVLALTGSNGKTTTKELLNAVLSKKYITHATKGNLNNHIGVPLTILGIHPQVEVAIIEMGANAVGEIAGLCRIAMPNHGLITNIGKAHLEGFGGIEGVIRGKSELYDYLLKNDGQVFINTMDPALKNMAKRFPHPILLPDQGSYMPIKLISADPYIIYESEQGEIINTNLAGAYNFGNIAYALAVGKFFGVDTHLANQAVSEYSPTNNRSQLITKNGRTIILDAYNANPDSMKAALHNLAKLPGKKLAIIGDMLELGEYAEAEHLAIGQLLTDLGIDEAFLVGHHMPIAARKFGHSKCFNDRAELITHMTNHPLTANAILIKASRGVALEKILDYL